MPSKNTGKNKSVKNIEISKGIVSFSIGKSKYELTLDAFESTGLKEGDEINQSYIPELEKIIHEDELYRYALKTLKKDAYSSYEIKKKLWKKGASLALSNKIISKLSELNLLDDQRFALAYATDVGPYKGYGKNKIISKLTKYGIPNDIIYSLEFKKEDELAKALKHVESLNAKLSKNPDRKKREKMISSLINDGFDIEIARQAIEKITPNDKTIMRRQLKLDFESTYRKDSKTAFGKELKQKVFRHLMNKGYEFEEILDLLKEEGLYEDD